MRRTDLPDNCHLGFWDFSSRIPELGKSPFGKAISWEEPGRLASEFNWNHKNPMNVPGIFYTGESDTCLTGRLEAPYNVLYDDQGSEFIFRPPANDEEVKQILRAALVDPFQAYSWDGLSRWTLSNIREWWRKKQRLLEWTYTAVDSQRFHGVDFVVQKQHEGIIAFRDFLNTKVDQYLKVLGFFVSEGHLPSPNEQLPDLAAQ